MFPRINPVIRDAIIPAGIPDNVLNRDGPGLNHEIHIPGLPDLAAIPLPDAVTLPIFLDLGLGKMERIVASLTVAVGWYSPIPVYLGTLRTAMKGLYIDSRPWPHQSLRQRGTIIGEYGEYR